MAALALASEVHQLVNNKKLSAAAEEVRIFIVEKLHYLVTSRPTAVNLSDAAHKLEVLVTERASRAGSAGHDVATAFIRAAEHMMVKDVEDNKKIGQNGAQWILANALKSGLSKASILTHCNTGYVIHSIDIAIYLTILL